MNRRRLWVVLLVTVSLALLIISPGRAQPLSGQASALAAVILNGDFEGDFYVYGSGQVAQYWVPFDLRAGSPPQFLRSTLHKHQGAASQQIWADNSPWHAGIQQTTALASSSSGTAQIKAGAKYTVRVWVYSIYGGAGSPVRNDKINKRVGIHPSGGISPLASDVVWTPWHGQDKTWIQINCAAVATGSRLTVFIEVDDPATGGQDQVYIDEVWIEEEGAPPPTATPTRTPVASPTPMPTATPAIGVVQTIHVGAQPQGVAVVPQMNRFFVANSGSDTVSSLEGFIGWRNTTIDSRGDRPTNVAVDEDQCRLYVVNTGSNNMTVLNACTSGSLLNTVALGTSQAPGAVAVLTTTKQIYVANTATNSVSVINAETLNVTTSIPVGPGPGQMATNPRTNKVYVTYRGTPSDNRSGVTVINANTLQTHNIGLSYSDQIPAPGPYGVAVNTVTNRVYVATEAGKMIVIDGANDTIIASPSPPVAGGLGSVAANPTSNHVFVSSASGNTVFVYDADDERWLSPVYVGTGLDRGMAVNALSNYVVVSNPGDDTVSIIRDVGAYQPLRIWIPIIRK